MKKYLAELNSEELKKVYEENEWVQEKNIECMNDEAYWQTADYINAINTKKDVLYSWSLGLYHNGYISLIDNMTDVMEGLDIVQKNYYLLGDKQYNEAKKLATEIQDLQDLVCQYENYGEDEEGLTEEEYWEKIDEKENKQELLENIVCERLNAEYERMEDDDACLEYFIYYSAYESPLGNCYILDDDYSTVYEEVAHN